LSFNWLIFVLNSRRRKEKRKRRKRRRRKLKRLKFQGGNKLVKLHPWIK
jgi:hypothetical protein